ncbi:MAG TPA: hypothetical protein VNW92_10210, partial [Polyangiaceae bacterium]|nr:hypothetical protein [Polyangiaceae bacterium]
PVIISHGVPLDAATVRFGKRSLLVVSFINGQDESGPNAKIVVWDITDPFSVPRELGRYHREEGDAIGAFIKKRKNGFDVFYVLTPMSDLGNAPPRLFRLRLPEELTELYATLPVGGVRSARGG